jgi:hypothetical protein
VLLDGSITINDAAGRQTLSLGETASLAGQSWIEHDGIGYVSLDPTNRTTVQAKLQSGSGAALPVFSTWVDHGVRPQNATYAYAVVPGVTADDVGSYVENLPIQILANTASIQAVHHLGLNQSQVAFYAAGSAQLGNGMMVAVDRAANLIVRYVGDSLVITAADPRQSSSPLTITLHRPLTGSGATILADGQSTRIVLPLPFGGSSVTRTFNLPADLPEGESPLLYDVALTSLAPARLSAPTGLSGYLASQSLAATTPATTFQPVYAVAETPSIWRPTAKAPHGQRLGQAHGGALDFDVMGTLAIDAALGIWNEMALGS